MRGLSTMSRSINSKSQWTFSVVGHPLCVWYRGEPSASVFLEFWDGLLRLGATLFPPQGAEVTHCCSPGAGVQTRAPVLPWLFCFHLHSHLAGEWPTAPSGHSWPGSVPDWLSLVFGLSSISPAPEQPLPPPVPENGLCRCNPTSSGVQCSCHRE